MMKSVRKAILCIVAILAIYLLAAAIWAWTVAAELVASYPVHSDARLSASQTGILLAIEDPTFFQHRGLSLADGQGLTTISSSVARDLFLFQGDLAGIKGGFQRFYRGVFACCKKVDVGRDVMALVLDARLPKEQQLSMYVAEAYMGSQGGAQVKGFAQAAQSYFGKPLGQLDDSEFAGLVAMVKAPKQFHPITHPADYALRLKRVSAILACKCQPAGWFDTTYEHCAQ